MNLFKAIWGLLFRLFPCPTPTGLRRIGSPTRQSSVLVTCNFHVTVRRVIRTLEKAGVDAWLVVADSKGVNVWCAAGGDEFNTRTVVAALKTCGVAEAVSHRHLILPPLGAPAIRPDEVRAQTGWSPRWGPVYACDIPRYLAGGYRKDEGMRRATDDWRERIDTALGSLFPFYVLGALGFLAFGRGLLSTYLVVGAVAFFVFMSIYPWLPGRHGLTKAICLEVILAAVLIGDGVLSAGASSLRPGVLIAMASLLLYSSELGGLAATLPSDLDPFLSRIGIGAVGNVALAGTVRTELLNGYRELTYQREECNGCRRCFEVCPQRVWEMDAHKRAVFARPADCTACRACLVQCMTDAIEARHVPGTPLGAGAASGATGA